MKLYLVRHGKYHINAQQLDELDREGKQEIENLAAFLKPLQINVAHIFHSTKLRAKQTAELLGPSFQCQHGIQEREGLAPTDEINLIKEEIESAGQDILLVGHLPFMSRLVSKLVLGDENKEIMLFYTSTMACLVTDGQQWLIEWVVNPDFFVDVIPRSF